MHGPAIVRALAEALHRDREGAKLTAPLEGAHAHAHAHSTHAVAAEGAEAAGAGPRTEVSGPVRGGSRAELADGRGRRAAGSLLRRRHS